MPLAPSPMVSNAMSRAKPKIGFSIDSLVGKKEESPRSSPELPLSPQSGGSPKSSCPASPSSRQTPSPSHEAIVTSSAAFPKLPPNEPYPAALAAAVAAQALQNHGNPNLPPGFMVQHSPHMHPLFLGPGGFPHRVPVTGAPPPGGPPIPPHHPREAYPLYPWLLSRHGRLFPHAFPGADAPGFLIQPFRKPKRIRTAFNPSQLLKLEQAFESNHYVVGAERKQLAQSLSLSETQVKVWFQNRRTKHKRIQLEEEQAKRGPPSRNSSNNASSSSTSSTCSSRWKERPADDSDDEKPLKVDEDD